MPKLRGVLLMEKPGQARLFHSIVGLINHPASHRARIAR
jgi:hypothetical protein